MRELEGQTGPIAALVMRHLKRQDLSQRALAERIDRSHTTIQRLLSGEVRGLKPWKDETLLTAIARELEIPETEIRKARRAELDLELDRDFRALKTKKSSARRRTSSG